MNAAARFREVLSLQGLRTDSIEELLDLFQEALDEQREHLARVWDATHT